MALSGDGGLVGVVISGCLACLKKEGRAPCADDLSVFVAPRPCSQSYGMRWEEGREKGSFILTQKGEMIRGEGARIRSSKSDEMGKVSALYSGVEAGSSESP